MLGNVCFIYSILDRRIIQFSPTSLRKSNIGKSFEEDHTLEGAVVTQDGNWQTAVNVPLHTPLTGLHSASTLAVIGTKPSANSTDPTGVMTSNIRWLRQRSLFTHLPFPTTSGSTFVTLFWHSGSPTRQSSATLYVRLWDFSTTLFVPKSINNSNSRY